MNTNVKLRWTVAVLLAIVLAQSVLLVMVGWRAAGTRVGGKMTELARGLFGKAAAPAVMPAAADELVVRDGMDDIQEIHDRIGRLFDELMAGAGHQGLHVAQPVAPAGGAPDGFYRLQREIDRIFERAFNDGLWRRARHPLDWSWERVAVSPGLRMTEDEDGYEITVALADVDRMGVDVSVHDGVLSISARGAQGSYVTRLRLPGVVDERNIEARYDDNILQVRVPKAAARETLATGRQII